MKKNQNRIDLERVKRLIIIALVSDDYLMETLVLKGGNAISVAYELSSRASFDLDFSIGDDFRNIPEVPSRMIKVLEEKFRSEGFYVFDFSFQGKPHVLKEELKDFWGGYKVTFKFIEFELLQQLGGETNFDAMRRNAVPIYPDQSPSIVIEISKYEFIDDLQEVELDGYTVQVYAPRLLIFEKVRAICQQLPQYKEVVPSFSPRVRTRDFYDIATLMSRFSVDLSSAESRKIMMQVFDAKRVPYEYLHNMISSRELHRQGFASLVDTVTAGEKENLKDFDFYFDYVIETFSSMLDEDLQKPLG
jgi:predicted nucleotidyltransferase component of viral defense system